MLKLNRYYSILKKFKNRLTSNNLDKSNSEDSIYKIGNLNILLPPNHALPIYQEKYKAYDKKIGVIAKLVEKNKPNSICIDIGANVGDTAAAIRIHSKMDIIAIEGNDYYLNYLRQNSITIGRIQIIECLVGADQGNSTNYELENNAGTAKLIHSTDSKQALKFSSLEEIIKTYNIQRDQIGFIKIDTDGFDFKIILSNKQLLKEIRPVLFFEYDIAFSIDGEQKGVESIKFLIEKDYTFIIYDNFGNMLYDLKTEYIAFFQNLNRYLKTCRVSGGGVYYLDILAIPKEFGNIKAEVLKFEDNLAGHFVG